MAQSISQPFIQDLLARIDIVDLIQQRINLKKTGANYSACCPFHSEKTPSFTVSEKKQFYYCFGCGVHGNAISFLMAYDRLTFVEAVEDLAHQLGIAIPQAWNISDNPLLPALYTQLEQVGDYYQSQLTNCPYALTYLKNRGLSTDTIKQFNLGFAPAGWQNLIQYFKNKPQDITQLADVGMVVKNKAGQYFDRFRNRIMIPIHNNTGRIIAFGGRTLGNDTPKYLNSPETTLFHKGNTLFGLSESRKNKDFSFGLIVEGYLDAIMLHQYGIPQAIATMGTAIGIKHLQQLLRYTKNIIFCFDGDNAGKAAAWRALKNSFFILQDDIQIRFMFLPNDQDPDSLIRQEGSEAFHKRITHAIPLSDFFFKQLCAQVELSTADGKAKLVALAKEFLPKISSSIFFELMVQQLAKLVGMAPQTLTDYLSNTTTTIKLTPNVPQAIKTKTTPVLLTPLQLAIAILLQYPQLVKQIDFEFKLSGLPVLPGTKTVLFLISQLRENPNLSTGALLEYWRNSKAVTQIAKLATWRLHIPVDGMLAELQGALHKIILQDREMRIQMLISKSNEALLTPEERELLIQLLNLNKH